MKIGFIGTGFMGSALASAASKNADNTLYLSNRTVSKAENLAGEIGGTVSSNAAVVSECDYVFLGVKPNMLDDVLDEIGGALALREGNCVLVTMLAGVKAESITDYLKFQCPVIRIMPNIPVMAGEGTILYACNGEVSRQQAEDFLSAMKFAGKFYELDEKLIDAGSAVSGCGPAYAAMFIEALADGGVACGLPRSVALELAAQMTAGSAKLIAEGAMPPSALKDAVCSPGGTTIQGVRALEDCGFRGAAMEAVIAAYEKTVG